MHCSGWEKASLAPSSGHGWLTSQPVKPAVQPRLMSACLCVSVAGPEARGRHQQEESMGKQRRLSHQGTQQLLRAQSLSQSALRNRPPSAAVKRPPIVSSCSAVSEAFPASFFSPIMCHLTAYFPASWYVGDWTCLSSWHCFFFFFFGLVLKNSHS